MIRIFQIVAVILGGIAAYFLWIDNKDGLFVAFVLASCSVFLSIRFQAKARLNIHNAEQAKTEKPGS